jgi:hypothetical protein
LYTLVGDMEKNKSLNKEVFKFWRDSTIRCYFNKMDQNMYMLMSGTSPATSTVCW